MGLVIVCRFTVTAGCGISYSVHVYNDYRVRSVTTGKFTVTAGYVISYSV